MRVLLFRSFCDTGGVSSWMQEHARQLIRRGAEPHFWFCRASPRLPEFHQIGPTTLGDMAGLVQAIESHRFDVVHVSSSDGAAEILSVLRPQPRIVATNRGALTDVWNSGDCFARTAVSRDMARLDQPLTDLLVEAIPNGLDTTRFTPPAESDRTPPIVAWVGRTTDILNKDFPRFTRIAGRLAGAGVRFWIADAQGADWSHPELATCTRMDVERWERIPHAEMPDFYRAVAASGGVVVMTSPAEGFGWAAVEAAASGAATIAPDVVGLRETVMAGTTGLLYGEHASDDEVAGLVRNWIGAQDGSADGMRVRARAIGEEFSLSRMTDRYLEVYQRARQLAAPVPRPRHDPADPALGIMLPRLSRMRRNRANAALTGIKELLEAGRNDVARAALGLMFRRVPREFFRSNNWQRSGKMAIRLLARRLRSR